MYPLASHWYTQAFTLTCCTRLNFLPQLHLHSLLVCGLLPCYTTSIISCFSFRRSRKWWLEHINNKQCVSDSPGAFNHLFNGLEKICMEIPALQRLVGTTICDWLPILAELNQAVRAPCAEQVIHREQLLHFGTTFCASWTHFMERRQELWYFRCSLCGP